MSKSTYTNALDSAGFNNSSKISKAGLKTVLDALATDLYDGGGYVVKIATSDDSRLYAPSTKATMLSFTLNQSVANYSFAIINALQTGGFSDLNLIHSAIIYEHEYKQPLTYGNVSINIVKPTFLGQQLRFSVVSSFESATQTLLFTVKAVYSFEQPGS